MFNVAHITESAAVVCVLGVSSGVSRDFTYRVSNFSNGATSV